MSDSQPTSDQQPMREFYVPATFQFSTEPGRVERFLARVFRQRGAMDGHPRPTEVLDDVYVPATTRDGVTKGMHARPR